MAQTNQEKSKLLRERRAKAGILRREYWATEKQHLKLSALLEKIKKKKKSI